MERRGFIKAGVAGTLLPPATHAARRRSHDFYFTRLAYESGDWEAAPELAGHVLRALAAASLLRVDPVERVVALDDARMLAAPFCYLGGSKLVQFNAAERRHLERYLRGGGFLLVHGCGPAIGLFTASFDAEMTRMFGAQALRRLPAAHPLYASFHRLDPAPHLRALSLRERVQVLCANQDDACGWDDGTADSLRLAVNIIHYALGA